MEAGDLWARPRTVSEGERPVGPAGAQRWPALRAQLQKRIEDLRFKIAAEKWGVEYAYYLFAQEARNAAHPLARDFTSTEKPYPGLSPYRAVVPNADYAAALAYYDRLIGEAPDTVYAEAARLYRALCLIHLGRAQEAERDLERFVTDTPSGLYRGEALLTLGDVHLQERWDPAAARRRFEQALAWCERVASITRGARLYAVPGQASEPARAPEAPHRIDRNGIISRTAIPPGAVVNRLTAPWYIDWLQTELRYRLGFLDALQGDWDAALIHWRKVLDHDPILARAYRERFYNTLHRLEATVEFGNLVGTEEENNRIPPQVKTAIWWADFLHMREHFQAADSLYTRIYHGASRRDPIVAARAGLGLMVCAFAKASQRLDEQSRILAESRALGEEILARFPRAPAAPYVAFMVAHSVPLNNRQNRAQAAEAFERVVRDYPRSRHVEEARFRILFALMTSETFEEHLPAVARFRRDFPESNWNYNLDETVIFLRNFRENARNAARARAAQSGHAD